MKGSWSQDWAPQLLSSTSPFVREARSGRFTLIGIDARHVGLNYSKASPGARDWPLSYYERDANDFAVALEVLTIFHGFLQFIS